MWTGGSSLSPKIRSWVNRCLVCVHFFTQNVYNLFLFFFVLYIFLVREEKQFLVMVVETLLPLLREILSAAPKIVESTISLLKLLPLLDRDGSDFSFRGQWLQINKMNRRSLVSSLHFYLILFRQRNRKYLSTECKVS